MPTKSSARSTRGEIRGLLSICFNPKVSLPDNHFIERMLDKLEFYVAIDFFLNETAQHADIVLPGSLQEEDEGVVTQIEGRVIKINKAVDCPGDARAGLAHHPGHRPQARPRTRLHVRQPARDFRGAARASAGGIADYAGITYERIEKRIRRLLALPEPRTIPARRGCSRKVRGTRSPRGKGRFYFPDGKARFVVAPYTPPAEDVDDEYPDHPHDRAAWSASSCPARRRAASGRWSISTRSR